MDSWWPSSAEGINHRHTLYAPFGIDYTIYRLREFSCPSPDGALVPTHPPLDVALPSRRLMMFDGKSLVQLYRRWLRLVMCFRVKCAGSSWHCNPVIIKRVMRSRCVWVCIFPCRSIVTSQKEQLTMQPGVQAARQVKDSPSNGRLLSHQGEYLFQISSYRHAKTRVLETAINMIWWLAIIHLMCIKQNHCSLPHN